MLLNTHITDAGNLALEAMRTDPRGTLLALDFDGTLAPIVDDPSKAHAHPRSVAALGRLGRHLGKIAIITGRPVQTALRLGEFRSQPGLESMVILGQYGVERWDASTGQMSVPPVPEGVAELAAMLPGWLRDRGIGEIGIEDKGRALVLHTRGLPDADALIDSLLVPVSALAAAHQMVVEKGRHVIEVRVGDSDKGGALRRIVAETGVHNIIFAGDDLGDLPAFRAAEQMRAEGMTTLLVHSASEEQDALAGHADLALDGPEDVAVWLEGLADSF